MLTDRVAFISLTQATDWTNLFATVKETILQNVLKDSGILWAVWLMGAICIVSLVSYFAFRTTTPFLMCGCCYHHTGPHLWLLSMFHPQASIYGYYTYHKRYSCSRPTPSCQLTRYPSVYLIVLRIRDVGKQSLADDALISIMPPLHINFLNDYKCL
jgi:hypothetical protein